MKSVLLYVLVSNLRLIKHVTIFIIISRLSFLCGNVSFRLLIKERVHFIYSTRNESRLKADIFQHLYQIIALNQLLRCRFLSNTLYSITHTAEFLLYKMEQRENSLRLAITVVGFPILK